MNSEQLYFEFTQQEYYGLVVANNIEHAIQIYQYFIAGDSIKSVREEGLPDEITQNEALKKYMYSSSKEDEFKKLDAIKKEFYEFKSEAILMDKYLR